MARARLVVLVLFAAIIVPTAAAATSCAPDLQLQNLSPTARAVTAASRPGVSSFIGIATGISARAAGQANISTLTTFGVEASLQDVSGPTVTVVTQGGRDPRTGSSMIVAGTPRFTVGDRYFVVGRRQLNGDISAGPCTETRAVSAVERDRIIDAIMTGSLEEGRSRWIYVGVGLLALTVIAIAVMTRRAWRME